MIIGVTGTLSSGKDSVSEYLSEKKGFGLSGTGDIIREYVEKAGLPSNRDTQRKMAGQLNEKYGSDFLLKEAIKRAKGENIVISGIRQPSEADYLTSGNNRFLIAVDAPIKIRFARMKERMRPGDPKSIKELREKEEAEMHDGRKDKNVQNISYCISHANFKLDNSGTKEELYKQIENVLRRINEKIKNPKRG